VQVSKPLSEILLGTPDDKPILEYILTEFHPVLVQALKDMGLSVSLETRVKLMFQLTGSVVVKMVSRTAYSCVSFISHLLRQ